MVLDVSGSFVGQVERWTASFRGTGAVAVRVSGPEITPRSNQQRLVDRDNRGAKPESGSQADLPCLCEGC